MRLYYNEATFRAHGYIIFLEESFLKALSSTFI